MSQQSAPVLPITPGLARILSVAANHPELFADDESTYHELMTIFQDAIPLILIPPSLWWFCHYWSNGRTCSKCLEISHSSPCDGPVSDQQFAAMTQSMTSGHDPSCIARNVCIFDGLKTSLSFHSDRSST